jgi:hypothetical protein
VCSTPFLNQIENFPDQNKKSLLQQLLIAVILFTLIHEREYSVDVVLRTSVFKQLLFCASLKVEHQGALGDL